MIASTQININHCRVWLFYNEMGAVAQCPNNWGVGSAFHPKKIHIYVEDIDEDGYGFGTGCPKKM